MMRFFDSDCQLADRNGLVLNILDQRGYRRRFEAEFRQKVADEKSAVAQSLAWHRESLLPMAEHNSSVRGHEEFNRQYAERIRAEIRRLEDRVVELDRRFPNL
jgi:hypothetical protein